MTDRTRNTLNAAEAVRAAKQALAKAKEAVGHCRTAMAEAKAAEGKAGLELVRARQALDKLAEPEAAEGAP